MTPTIRANFSDTALWQPHLPLDKDGRAEIEIPFPQSLTTWRIQDSSSPQIPGSATWPTT